MEDIIQNLIGSYGWLVVTTMVAFFFKNGIENAFFGLKWLAGSDFNKDMIVYISDKKVRIARQGIFKTTFYSLDDNKVFHIPNNKLQNHIIKKSLPKE